MEISNIFSSALLYNLARGPLVWISFLIFFIGSIYQVLRILSLTKIDKGIGIQTKDSKDKKGAAKEKKQGAILNWFQQLKLTIVGVSPTMILVTTVFHICLFIVPVFLFAHNIMLDDAWGLRLFTFSEKTSDILTIIFLATALFFLLRRLFVGRVRSITSFYDYFLWCVATAPFLTGFLAYHQMFDYRTVIVLHMLLGEVMLITIPFTKFAHMFFFFISRFFVKSEYSLGKGSRSWH
jgi:nitrate reductase gamma subunit